MSFFTAPLRLANDLLRRASGTSSQLQPAIDALTQDHDVEALTSDTPVRTGSRLLSRRTNSTLSVIKPTVSEPVEEILSPANLAATVELIAGSRSPATYNHSPRPRTPGSGGRSPNSPYQPVQYKQYPSTQPRQRSTNSLSVASSDSTSSNKPNIPKRLPYSGRKTRNNIVPQRYAATVVAPIRQSQRHRRGDSAVGSLDFSNIPMHITVSQPDAVSEATPESSVAQSLPSIAESQADEVAEQKQEQPIEEEEVIVTQPAFKQPSTSSAASAEVASPASIELYTQQDDALAAIDSVTSQFIAEAAQVTAEEHAPEPAAVQETQTSTSAPVQASGQQAHAPVQEQLEEPRHAPEVIIAARHLDLHAQLPVNHKSPARPQHIIQHPAHKSPTILSPSPAATYLNAHPIPKRTSQSPYVYRSVQQYPPQHLLPQGLKSPARVQAQLSSPSPRKTIATPRSGYSSNKENKTPPSSRRSTPSRHSSNTPTHQRQTSRQLFSGEALAEVHADIEVDNHGRVSDATHIAPLSALPGVARAAQPVTPTRSSALAAQSRSASPSNAVATTKPATPLRSALKQLHAPSTTQVASPLKIKPALKSPMRSPNASNKRSKLTASTSNENMHVHFKEVQFDVDADTDSSAAVPVASKSPAKVAPAATKSNKKRSHLHIEYHRDENGDDVIDSSIPTHLKHAIPYLAVNEETGYTEWRWKELQAAGRGTKKRRRTIA